MDHPRTPVHLEIELDCGPCRLRSLRAQDAPALARHADNAKVARRLRDRFPHPYSHDDAVRFIEHATLSRDECIAGIEVNGEAAGAIGLELRKDVERCSAELGYWLGEPFWGRGVTVAAIRCFLQWAMPRFALTRVYAEVFDDNPASARVLEKAGFARVGVLRKAAIKHGVHHDYVLYDFVL